MSSFIKKEIECNLRLSASSFSSGGNTVNLKRLATKVAIEKLSPPDINKASIQIYGMKLEDMAQLTTLAFKPLESQYNTIEVLAGDEGKLSLIFKGEIQLCFANFTAAPNIFLDIQAMTGSYPMQVAIPPTTNQGKVLVSTIIKKLTDGIGYSFVNEGVMGSLNNSVLNGSPIEQIFSAANQVGADILIDDGSVILKLRDKARKGQIPLISAATGMIGYPSFISTGISCNTVYNPNLVMGGNVQIESVVPKATGTWMITKLSHSLAAFMPEGGDWKSSIEAVYV